MLCRLNHLYTSLRPGRNLYTVRDHITGQQIAQPTPLSVDTSSEFLQAVNGKDSVAAWDIINDLMDTLKAVNPKVYATILNKFLDL